MQYLEMICDLFSMPEEYFLVQCISADFAMGKGIAVAFNQHFDVKNKLKRALPDYRNEWNRDQKMFDCIRMERVLNLVTKQRYFHKPTYHTLQGALQCMKETCRKEGITKVAMPLIGCGLDGLSWEIVSELIKAVFQDTEMEIVVCQQEK